MSTTVAEPAAPVRRRGRSRPAYCTLGTPSPARIRRALPPGAGRARSQHTWLLEVEDHAAVAALRADARDNLLALARVIAHAADWSDLTSRPTWDRLTDLTGLSRRTVARWLAWLRSQRLLGVVESGSTPQLRPMALAHLEGNRAALYVLASTSPTTAAAAAHQVITGTPPDLTEGENPPRARARADVREKCTNNHNSSPLRGPDHREAAPLEASWGWCQPTTHRRSRLMCSQRLQERVPVLRRLSDRHLRSVLRPWLSAGWTAADVLRAIDYAPDGRAHTWTTDVRSPSGWLLRRMQLWTDPSGSPLPALSAQQAERAAERAKAQAEARVRARETRAALDLEQQLGDLLAAACPDLWARLLRALTPGRRAPGPMAQALARSAVRRHLPAEQVQPAAVTLTAAAHTALLEVEAAAR